MARTILKFISVVGIILICGIIIYYIFFNGRSNKLKVDKVCIYKDGRGSEKLCIDSDKYKQLELEYCESEYLGICENIKDIMEKEERTEEERLKYFAFEQAFEEWLWKKEKGK